jgi:hypothetical protein
MRQRAIILLGGIAGVIAAALGLTNATGATELTAESIGAISAGAGAIATFGVAILRSWDEEPVFVFLAGLATAASAFLSIGQAADWWTLSDANAGSIITVITAVTALAASVLRGTVTAPANLLGE